MKKIGRTYATIEELYKNAQPTYASAGGFIAEDQESNEAGSSTKKSKFDDDSADDLDEFLDQAGGFVDNDGKFVCNECKKPFIDSFLLKNFFHPVCDECKDLDGCHELITRTDAKNEYLLKDCDFQTRTPPLKYISRKNPHNPRWGDMKLYLKLQVERRALEVWGSAEALEDAREKRFQNKESLKQKRFEKKIKELRKQVRTDLYRKPPPAHQHDYGEEQGLDDGETFFKICKSCSHRIEYEKL